MAEKPIPAAVEIWREVNANILALDARLPEVSVHMRVPDEDLIGFFCECGCMGRVAATRTDYNRNGGAWLEGHEPAQSD